MDYQEDAELAAVIKGRTTRYGAPAGLQERIGAALQAAEAPAATTAAKPRWQKWLPMAAAFACGMIAAVGINFFHFSQFPGEEDELLTQEVVASHVRSLMGSHLADVASSDQHTVKPWFAGKLDFSPPVADLAADGFALTGGRLDYIGQRPVAALIYRHRGHWINVFVWPSPGATAHGGGAPGAPISRQGFNLIGWRQGEMQFRAISDINAADLSGFAKLLQERNAQ